MASHKGTKIHKEGSEKLEESVLVKVEVGKGSSYNEMEDGMGKKEEGI